MQKMQKMQKTQKTASTDAQAHLSEDSDRKTHDQGADRERGLSVEAGASPCDAATLSGLLEDLTAAGHQVKTLRVGTVEVTLGPRPPTVSVQTSAAQSNSAAQPKSYLQRALIDKRERQMVGGS